jgi:transcriptional regulator of acetoin/glycerol metabolism
VRELRFAVERANLLADGPTIELSDLPPEIVERFGAAEAAPATRKERVARESSVTDDEPDLERVRQALEKSRWRRGDAARILGISPRTLHRWMKRLNL